MEIIYNNVCSVYGRALDVAITPCGTALHRGRQHYWVKICMALSSSRGKGVDGKGCTLRQVAGSGGGLLVERCEWKLGLCLTLGKCSALPITCTVVVKYNPGPSSALIFFIRRWSVRDSDTEIQERKATRARANRTRRTLPCRWSPGADVPLALQCKDF